MGKSFQHEKRFHDEAHKDKPGFCTTTKQERTKKWEEFFSRDTMYAMVQHILYHRDGQIIVDIAERNGYTLVRKSKGYLEFKHKGNI